MNLPQVVCIVGPTATGKSDLAVFLARQFAGEVLSVDSMQLYGGFTIGTAKIQADQQSDVPHHLIDVLPPTASCSVAQYCAMAQPVLDSVLARRHLPILAGGTGLYLNGLLGEIRYENMPDSSDARDRLTEIAQQQGENAVWEMLKKVDPESAAAIHPHNVRRVIRALEVYEATGEKMSQIALRARQTSRYSACKIGLTYADRALLYQRIDERVDKMLENGLLDEVQSLLDTGVSPQCQAMQGIGYKECLPVLSGEISVQQAAEEIKLHSRRYAKRQLTWFRRDPAVHWLAVDDEPDLSAHAAQLVQSFLEEGENA